MNIRFMLSVLVVAAILVALLVIAFYFGIRYHARITSGAWQNLPTAETHREAEPVLVETLQTVPAPEKNKPTIEAPTKTSRFSWGQSVDMRVGESAVGVAGDTNQEQLEVLFADVVYDGRCPEESDCMVAGEAVVELVAKFGDKTQKIYISTQRGGKSDYWATWKFEEKDYTPETFAAIKRAQEIANSTTYALGSAYKSSKAVVGGYTFHLDSLTPGRHLDPSGAVGRVPVIPKSNYLAKIVIDRE